MDEQILAGLCAALELLLRERASDGSFDRSGLAPSGPLRVFSDSPAAITERRLGATFGLRCRPGADASATCRAPRLARGSGSTCRGRMRAPGDALAWYMPPAMA